MTREENLEYRNRCPYDAMGDYSLFSKQGKEKDDGGHIGIQPNVSVKNMK